MIRYLIKNNFKLMMRSVTNIVLFIVSPIILIALLSSAFEQIMKTYAERGTIKAGYRIEGEVDQDMAQNKYAVEETIKLLESTASDNDFNLAEYTSGEVEEIIRDEELAGFIVFDQDGSYTVYENDDQRFEAKALEYMVSAVYEGVGLAFISTDPANGIGKETDIQIMQADYMEPISSTDYYGIIEVIYFGWCAIVCGAGLFTAEKKYRIGKKIQVSGISDLKIYLAKFIPMFLIVSISSLIASIISSLFLGVHWGNILLSGLIVILSTSAATAFGLMFYNITNNMVVSVIGVFAIVWFLGFWGGSFETYMFSNHPQILKDISPIYHINRALVELSCMGHSDYISSAIIYSLGILFACSLIAIAASYIRRRKGL